MLRGKARMVSHQPPHLCSATATVHLAAVLLQAPLLPALQPSTPHKQVDFHFLPVTTFLLDHTTDAPSPRCRPLLPAHAGDAGSDALVQHRIVKSMLCTAGEVVLGSSDTNGTSSMFAVFQYPTRGAPALYVAARELADFR